MFTAENAGSHKRYDSKKIKRVHSDDGISLLDPGILLIAAGLVTAFILLLLSFLFPGPAGAAPLQQNETFVKPAEVREGSLLFKNVQTGRYVSAPQLATDVRIEITGMVAYARVIQEFHNPGDEWLEGVYVFPLPENAAVNRLVMDIGDRVIEGMIKERQQAQKTYQNAKKEGKKASLLEQERPNVFTMSVANIGPREHIRVELVYQETVRLDSGIFSIRFPTVVGPRYIPGSKIIRDTALDEFEPVGWAFATDEVVDAPRITPPVVEPGQDPVNPVTLEIILDPGFRLSRLQSLYHSVDIDEDGDGFSTVSLNNRWAFADQDFVLEWAPLKGKTPQAALFSEVTDGDQYLFFMVMPPERHLVIDQHVPREMVFVMDVSGSMGGTSIRQARKALSFALKRLKPADRFNIITFNSLTDKLFNRAQPATAHYIDKALDYVEGLKADGGTEIEPAILEALDGRINLDRIRQVVFLTDGCVGNEQALFKAVRQRLGDSRVFTIGIGSAPNSYFMRNIAERGHGTFTYIGNVNEVRDRMEELFKKLEHPLLTDLHLSFTINSDTEMFPNPIPDLYLGEPVTVVARIDEMPDALQLTGNFAGRPWQTAIDTRNTGQGNGISILWARQKIKSLMDSLDSGLDRNEVRKQVIDTALKHHLVSKYTSLVAVDVTPSRPAGEPLNRAAARTNLPKGWQYEKVFGLPQTATVSEFCFIQGMIALLLAGLICLLARRRKAG
jgi:Ca-activated chloride channel family protein